MTQHTEELVGMAGRWPVAAKRRSMADFDAVFRGNYDGVYRFLFRMLGSRDEAEDVAQEAFVRFWQHDFAADRHHNVRAWLYRVAGNLALNRRRGASRRGIRELAAGADGLIPQSEDPADVAARWLERDAVRDALATLPERQRQLLWLRHGGLSYSEVADAIGVAPASVGTLLARAELAFAAAYSSDGPSATMAEEDAT